MLAHWRLAVTTQTDQVGSRSSTRPAAIIGEIVARDGDRVKAQEIAFMQKLAGARDLWSQNLYPITKLTYLEREAARVEGERAQLVANAQPNARTSCAHWARFQPK